MTNDKNLPKPVSQAIVPHTGHGKTLIGRALAKISEDNAAKNKHSHAQIAHIFYKKGLDYYLGHNGKVQSYNDALQYFNYAEMFGSCEAQYRLAEMYRRGRGVETSIEKAVELLQLSAEGGYALSQACLGSIYQHPFLYDLTIDTNEAERLSVYWTELAAKNEVGHAQNSLAVRYREGRGVSQSYEQAAYWFKKSSINSGRDSFSKTNSQINLAIMYLRGLGVERSVSNAFELLESAAANESRYSYHAEHILGDLYFVAEYIEDAISWYKRAAKRNHPLSMHNLGLLYEGGFGVAISYKDAFDWYQKAEKRKHPNATTRLALMYERGLGVQQNYMVAFNLYQTALERGCAEAYIALAAMYKEGLYVAQSDEMAEALIVKMNEESEKCMEKIRKYESRYKFYLYE